MNTFGCEIQKKKGKTWACCKDFDIHLPDFIPERDLSLPLEATIGIRPQYITWNFEDKTGRGIRCYVEVVEPVGTENIVHCFINNTEIITVFPSQQQIKEGSTIYLDFDLKFMQIFSGRDEEASLLAQVSEF